jgi:hypothetical protein
LVKTGLFLEKVEEGNPFWRENKVGEVAPFVYLLEEGFGAPQVRYVYGTYMREKTIHDYVDQWWCNCVSTGVRM